MLKGSCLILVQIRVQFRSPHFLVALYYGMPICIMSRHEPPPGRGRVHTNHYRIDIGITTFSRYIVAGVWVLEMDTIMTTLYRKRHWARSMHFFPRVYTPSRA